MKVTELFQNEDNQWTVEVAAKPGYFYRSKSSSVQFSLGEKLFKLKMKKSGGNLCAKIKSLDNVQFGFKAKVTQQQDKVEASDEVFSLCDSRHTIRFSKLPSHLFCNCQSEVRLKLVFCDFYFVCNDKHVPAFKCKLVKKSTVFDRMFQSPKWIESQDDRMVIEDFDTSTVESMVYFLNFQKLPKMTTRCKSELLLIADKYDMSGLVYICESELSFELEEKNCFLIFNLAAFIKASYLQEACLSFILLRWTSLSKNDIFAIYQYKELIIQAIIKLQISTIPDVNQFYFSSDGSDESKTYFDSVKWKMALNSMNLNNNRIKVVLDFYNDTDANQKVLEVLLNGLHAIQSN
jgi:hypothetical protein